MGYDNKDRPKQLKDLVMDVSFDLSDLKFAFRSNVPTEELVERIGFMKDTLRILADKKEISTSRTFRPTKNIEIWWNKGDWYRPRKWHFGIDKDCGAGCIIIGMGFTGITILRGECLDNQDCKY